MAPLPFRRVAGLLVVALSAAGCAQPAETADAPRSAPLRVGFLTPDSGSDVEPRTPAQEGARLAVDLVNEATSSVDVPLAGSGGLPSLHGARARLVLDDRADAMSTAQVDRLVEDRGVDVLVGVGGPEDLHATSQQANRLGVPYVGGGSTSGFLTDRGLEWFFHTAATDEQVGEAFAALLDRRPDRGRTARVAVVFPQDAKGAAAANDVEAGIHARGYAGMLAPVRPDDRHDTGAYADALGEALSSGDVVGAVMVAREPEAAEAATEAASATARGTVDGVLGLGAGFEDRETQRTLAHTLPGLLVDAPWPSDWVRRSATATRVSDLYRDRFGRTMDVDAAAAFTATYTALRAADAAHATDGQQVRAALSALDVPGRELVMPWDGVRFDARHRNIGARAAIEQLTGDDHDLVEPEDLARVPVTWGTDAERGA